MFFFNWLHEPQTMYHVLRTMCYVPSATYHVLRTPRTTYPTYYVPHVLFTTYFVLCTDLYTLVRFFWRVSRKRKREKHILKGPAGALAVFFLGLGPRCESDNLRPTRNPGVYMSRGRRIVRKVVKTYYGLWTTYYGLRTTNYGLWITYYGLRTTYYVVRSTYY